MIMFKSSTEYALRDKFNQVFARVLRKIRGRKRYKLDETLRGLEQDVDDRWGGKFCFLARTSFSEAHENLLHSNHFSRFKMLSCKRKTRVKGPKQVLNVVVSAPGIVRMRLNGSCFMEGASIVCGRAA